MKSKAKRPAQAIPPAVRGASAARPLRRRFLAALGVLGVLAAMGTWAAMNPRAQPSPLPPEIDLTHAPPRVAQAVREARQRVIESPASGAAWGHLGMVLLAHEYDQPTTFCLAQAERLQPEEFRWPYFLGVNLSVSDPAAAARHFQRAVELRPDEPIVHARLGEILLHLEQFDEAGLYLRRAIELDPHDPRPHIALARLALARGDAESAMPSAEFAIRAAPQERAVHETLALVHQRGGRRAEALQSLARAEQLPARPLGWNDPFAGQVHALRKDASESLALATALQAQNRVQEAIEVLRDALASDDRDPRVDVALARVYLAANQPQQAEAVLAEAQVRHPQSAEVWLLRGAVCFLREDFEGAIESFGGALARKPDYADAHYNLGHARLRLGDDAGAAEAFGCAIRFCPAYAHARTNLAKLHLKAGRREEAAKQVRFSLELDPTDPEAQALANQLDRQETQPP
jgi:tetratricopeptide (TPR) repeat protein